MHPITRRQALRRMGYLGGALTLPSALPLADFPAPQEKLGGPLMDLGPYTIQATGSLPVRVQAQGFRDDPDLFKDIYGTYTWQLEFDDRTLFNSTVSFSSYVDRLHVARANQYLELRPAFVANAELTLRTRTEEVSFPPPEYQQIAQMDAFARNILDDTPVLASGEEGLIDMQIIAAIKRSIERGQAVPVGYGE